MKNSQLRVSTPKGQQVRVAPWTVFRGSSGRAAGSGRFWKPGHGRQEGVPGEAESQGWARTPSEGQAMAAQEGCSPGWREGSGGRRGEKGLPGSSLLSTPVTA